MNLIKFRINNKDLFLDIEGWEKEREFFKRKNMIQEEKEFCESCQYHNNCGFISRRLEYKCDKLDNFLQGWEKAIKKACEWLQENCAIIWESPCNPDKVVKQFRKAMEGGEE